jgi:hypothetical protein
MTIEKPVILDLCGGTGAWSRPWAESGEYDVMIITLPHYDIRYYKISEKHIVFQGMDGSPDLWIEIDGIYGILAAPPCTDFSIAANRLWKKKDGDGSTAKSIEVVRACLGIIEKCQPMFWALENPTPPLCRIQKCVLELGKPRLLFDPCDYGDSYTKKTAIWGDFVRPVKWFTMRKGKSQYICHQVRSAKKRSITPPDFAKAFFEANRIRRDARQKEVVKA